ncbi:MAG: biotin transporter BioY [Eubacteriales bacterium]|nr:biotin transporter BioY [Eubacteriales bacterium]
MKLQTKDMLRIALFSALIVLCTYISIPAAVPFTMQTFAVFLALAVLGGKNGSIAIVVYILLGAVGLPVFAGGKGGIFALIGPTGGYLTGFILMGLCFRLITNRLGTGTLPIVLALLAGLLLCYAYGTVWFVMLYVRAAKPITLGAALGMCVLPFLLPDALKLTLAMVLAKRLKPLVK